MPTPLLDTIRRALAEHADPARAPAMQAYMKSALPYYGVPLPKVRAIAKAIFAGLIVPDAATYRRLVLELWRGATHREERYAAIELTRYAPICRRFRSPDLLPLYEEMIVTGAWWDFVDELATHPVSALVVAHPEVMKPIMRAWSRDPNLWKRRTAILHQLHAKAPLDVPLLEEAIEGSIDDKDFFARKAIGWALRERGKTDPEGVKAYVRANETRLSGLSKREALKSLGTARPKGKPSRSGAARR